MKSYFSQTQAFIFLTLLIFDTSCNGQVKKDLPKEKVLESKIISAGQPKLIKTLGSQPGDNVHCGLQDKAGNLWFGTTGEGVYKYDGKSFSQFTATNGLNSNMVYCILEDKNGKIWIGTVAGVCLYNGKTFTKIQIPLPKNMPSNKYHNTHDVFSIMQDKSGKLWLATIDGVYIYDGKSFTPFIVNEGVGGFKSSNHNVEYILEDKAGNIWFGGRVNEGVFRYDGKSITNLKPNGDHWVGPFCMTKTEISGSATGAGPTVMMVNHLQVLQKIMACPVMLLPELQKTQMETFGSVALREFAATMESLSLFIQQKTD